MREQVLAVQRMQDYIREHLSEEITLTKLAQVSLFSPWYSRRLFEQYTGVTPSEYIRKLRLSQSALRLRDENCKILDVALDAGFDSVDGYQRAFLKEFGCNPKEYSLHPVPICLFTPFGVQSIYMKRRTCMEPSRNVFISIIEKPTRKVLIKRAKQATDYFEYCNEVGCDIWGVLKSIPSISNEPICLWLTQKYRLPDTSEYVQGVEIADDISIPDGFDVITLPTSKYLMFQGEPFDEVDYEAAIQEIWEAEKKYDPSVLDYMWDNENPRIQLEPIGTRGYIEYLPIQTKK